MGRDLSPSDCALLDQADAAVRSQAPIGVALLPTQWAAVVALMQLGLKHPTIWENQPAATRAADTIGRQITALLPIELQRLLSEGWQR